MGLIISLFNVLLKLTRIEEGIWSYPKVKKSLHYSKHYNTSRKGNEYTSDQWMNDYLKGSGGAI
jgi:hypothetical protein